MCFLKKFKVIFWDFDGVIKESVDVKTRAFATLFSNLGSDFMARVVKHHEAHGGVSRFEKIPQYLIWAGIKPTQKEIKDYCDRFSNHVLQAVVDSPWVPGALEYIRAYKDRQIFFIVTATPQNEMEIILDQLGIRDFFRKAIGAPMSKVEAIAEVLAEWDISKKDALMIGDSDSDLSAAEYNGLPFLLRRTPINGATQAKYMGPQCDNFI